MYISINLVGSLPHPRECWETPYTLASHSHYPYNPWCRSIKSALVRSKFTRSDTIQPLAGEDAWEIDSCSYITRDDTSGTGLRIERYGSFYPHWIHLIACYFMSDNIKAKNSQFKGDFHKLWSIQYTCIYTSSQYT